MQNRSLQNIFATGSTGTIGRYLPSEVQPLQINLLEFNELNKIDLPENNTTLIHLAGIVGDINVTKDIETSRKINIEGTLALAGRILRLKNYKFVYVSTSHVYKNSQGKLSELSPTEPISEYAKQKLETETLLQNLIEPENLTIVRVFSLLDWGMPENSLGGAAQKVLAGEKDFVINTSDDVRDFLSPSQVAAVLYKIALHQSTSGIFNLCSGHGIKVRDAIQILINEKNCEKLQSRLISGNSSVPSIVGDNSKILNQIPGLNLKWQPLRSA